MIYPSIDKLLKQVGSKFLLVNIVSKRVEEMEENEDYQLNNYKSSKNIGKALEEIEKNRIKWSDVVTVSRNASDMGGSQIYLEGDNIVVLPDEDDLSTIKLLISSEKDIQNGGADTINPKEDRFSSYHAYVKKMRGEE